MRNSYFYLPPRQRPGTGDIATPPRPSRLVFENAMMYFLKTLQVRTPCHGGVLYSFWYWWNVWIFYEFLNIKKNKILRILFFNISCFLRVWCYFQQILFLKYWKVPLHLLVIADSLINMALCSCEIFRITSSALTLSTPWACIPTYSDVIGTIFTIRLIFVPYLNIP